MKTSWTLSYNGARESAVVFFEMALIGALIQTSRCVREVDENETLKMLEEARLTLLLEAGG